ncbi:hypothetical protein F511_16683 [Dorcoceras hygrometricum]|uniref:RING-CH-type domain-containing protein n=1 Tax=Dorcoceras hygrometricum TaxID=472368 RepID=A0A2Z7CVM2_9LAMI|nr:hypothetical protein F511_16683 [Dorcoceras hygrometricum]
MGDHFVLLVDRLLTESTLEATIKSRNFFDHVAPLPINGAVTSCSSREDYEGSSLSPRKVVECRICQDEDFDSNMETPCSCCGSLKVDCFKFLFCFCHGDSVFNEVAVNLVMSPPIETTLHNSANARILLHFQYAHRKCVQRWCNEKGDTMCEICHQQFKPGYTAPPPILRLGGLPMNLRGHWQIARGDSTNPHIITMVSTDRSFLDQDYNEYAVSTTRSIACCRSVAMLFMVLLILRHTLPVIVSRAGNYSFPLIALMLRVTGIILPICIILKAVTSILRRDRQANLSFSPPDEEAGPLALHPPHVIDET